MPVSKKVMDQITGSIRSGKVEAKGCSWCDAREAVLIINWDAPCRKCSLIGFIRAFCC